MYRYFLALLEKTGGKTSHIQENFFISHRGRISDDALGFTITLSITIMKKEIRKSIAQTIDFNLHQSAGFPYKQNDWRFYQRNPQSPFQRDLYDPFDPHRQTFHDPDHQNEFGEFPFSRW